MRAVDPVVHLKAEMFPLSAVRLLKGPFRRAMEADRAYLLRLDPDRLLSHVRKNAGLTPKAPPYGGWDETKSEAAGHHLTACALMYAATGDPVLKKRVDYFVSELAECQRAAGDGGIYANLWDRTEYFAKLAQGDLIRVPVTPWYHVHKIMAGLRDAWLECGNTLARDTLIRMADWCIAVTARLGDAQWQEMLAGEHGAPHEILADVYAMTGERTYLACAERFCHHLVFDPLSNGDDRVLDNIHANSQIPKFTGYERIYELTGERSWHDAALHFWDRVSSTRSWVNGGNSQWEQFFSPQEFEKKVTDACGPETCNTYNMLKLARRLYMLEPSVRYIDYYERALYNHILASEDPVHGGFVYYTSMRPGAYRVYSRDYDAFWCCVNTGTENHAKYGELIYARSGDRLYVNLFVASELKWPEKGMTIRQETTFPDTAATSLVLSLNRSRQLTISVRCPGWMRPGTMTVRINGKAIPLAGNAGHYADITRTWKTGDRIDVGLPMRLSTETLPLSRRYAAFLCGPILLAGRLGTEGLTPSDFLGDGGGALARKTLPLRQVPVLVGPIEGAAPRLVSIKGKPLTFRTKGLARPRDVTLVPFYRIHRQRYAIYWRVMDEQAYSEERRTAAREAREAQDLEARTIDCVHPGDPASESEHALASDRSNTGAAMPPYKHSRDATGWFSYVVRVSPEVPLVLRCAYWGGDVGRVFDVLIDGRVIAMQALESPRPGEYMDLTYAISPELTRGKEKVTVRFEAHAGSIAGGLFDLRVARAR